MSVKYGTGSCSMVNLSHRTVPTPLVEPILENKYSERFEFRKQVSQERFFPVIKKVVFVVQKTPSVSNANLALSDNSPHTILGLEKSSQ
jgi:hypothetical protein